MAIGRFFDRLVHLVQQRTDLSDLPSQETARR